LENITFLIGPEGDFSEKEISFLAENKIKAVSLGNQRLRTETAGIFVALELQ
jgi:16S rRNA (uracil1498-N3)-methyltransferase